jgi:hypothetical protein
LERALAQGGVSSNEFASRDLVFKVARRDDEADLRRLLRENETEGWIRLALTREPDAFVAASTMGPHHGYVIARNRDTQDAVGMCEWSARESFIDGEPRLLAYLGALRIAPRYRHRIAVLKGGFAAVHRLLHCGRATAYALTAIAEQNHTALRLLGANLPGMPTYHPLDAFSTFALRPRPTPSAAFIERATAEDLPAIAVCLARSYRALQFAPVWCARDLSDPKRCPRLNSEDFLVVRRGPGIAACVALWDQNEFKQTRIFGYAGWLGRARPLVNLAAPLLGTPHLPAAGRTLRQIYLSHLAIEDDDEEISRALIDAALAEAYRRGFALALVGLATRRRLAQVVRRAYRPREYRTLLHLVDWRSGQQAAALPIARLPHVEIAVL